MAVKVPSKLHTMSPTFQKAWYKRNKMELPAHLTGSVKQASKEVKPSERVKKLQTKSLQAYGATKGLKVGGEHGSGEMKDTIAPLTRDQHSKVQAAARAAKAAEKSATKKPLTKNQRIAAIAAAVRKAKTKHDVPTMDPDDESHDDLRDLHQSLHIRKGYNEAVEQIDEIRIAGVLSAMEKARYNPQVGDKIRTRMGGQIPGTVTKVTDTHVHFTHPEGKKYKTSINNVMREEVESVEEAQKKLKPSYWRAEWRLGTQTEVDKNNKKIYDRLAKTDPAKAKAFHDNLMKMRKEENESKKQPSNYPGQRLQRDYLDRFRIKPKEDWKTKQDREYALATGDKAGRWAHGGKYEEVEMNEVSKKEAEEMLGGPVKEKPKMPPGKQPAGYRYVRGLARKAMKSGMNKMQEAVKDAADVGEYDYEGDMAKSQLRSILTHAKRLHDMLEDTTNLPEWVQSKITLAEDYIVTAANYMEGEMNEEVEQVDEGYKDASGPYKKFSGVGKPAKQPLLGKEGSRRKGHIRDIVQSLQLMDASKPISADHHAKILSKLDRLKEEVEQVDEKAPPGAKYERMVKHIKKGYAKGGLTDKEKSIAYATAWKAYKKNEEVEQIDELDRKTRVSYLKKSLTQLNNIASSRHTSGNKNYGAKEVGKRLAGLSRLEKGSNHPASVKYNIDKTRAQFEEVEQTDEAIRGYIQSRPGNEDGTAIRRPADQAERDQLAKNLAANRKYNVGKKIGAVSGGVRSNAAGMTSSQKISTALRSSDASKELGPKKFPYMPKNAKITPFLSKEEVEQVTESEGSVPTTPKEKELAKHHGDPNKITYGDVVKARIKSAAAKAMNKGK